jgi:hypothetical protein
MTHTAHLRDVTAQNIKREARPLTGSSRLELASVYRENLGSVAAFFARRCREPQQVADLTSQTFVEPSNPPTPSEEAERREHG